jgi:hypothetical protein
VLAEASNINYRYRFARSYAGRKALIRSILIIAIVLNVSSLAEAQLSSPPPEVAADRFV